MGLGHARRDSAHSLFADEFDVDTSLVVRILQVVDKLGEVFNGVNVVVRGRRDEPHTGRRVAGLGDPWVDLGAGQLAALTGLGPLGHLDLQVVGVHQVATGDPESAGGDLLDRRTTVVVRVRGVEALGVLAALAGIGLAAESVHGDRQCRVRLLGDRAVGHRAGGEALDDRRHTLDLVDRERCRARYEIHQGAQRELAARLTVHHRGVLLEDVKALLARGVLEFLDRARVEQVQLAVAAPLVLAAVGDLDRLADRRMVGATVQREHALGNVLESDTANARVKTREVARQHGLRDSDRLEQLRADVARHRRDTHLGHGLDDALVERLTVLVASLETRELAEFAALDQGVDGFVGEVGAHRRRAKTEQQRHVVDLAHVTRLENQSGAGAQALADESVVDRRGEQQTRDGGVGV